jgi:ribosomal protein S18 acetylase RimI-like enzyme
MNISYSDNRVPSREQTIGLYRSVEWSSADKPEALMLALAGSHSLVTAWHDDALVGLANAISDGHLVAYFPHLLVDPSFQHRGIGASLIRMLLGRYAGFHQVVLLADAQSTDFYKRVGFEPGGSTVPMWIYQGHDHE